MANVKREVERGVATGGRTAVRVPLPRMAAAEVASSVRAANEQALQEARKAPPPQEPSLSLGVGPVLFGAGTSADNNPMSHTMWGVGGSAEFVLYPWLQLHVDVHWSRTDTETSLGTATVSGSSAALGLAPRWRGEYLSWFAAAGYRLGSWSAEPSENLGENRIQAPVAGF